MAAALIAPTGDAPLHDAASMAARLRCLTREDGDVAMAASIVDDLLGRRHTPTSGVAATSWHASSVGVPGASLGLPRAVGAHYLKYVLDWLVSQLVRQQAGGAPKPQQGAKQGGGTTGGHTTPAAAAQVQQGIQPHALTRPGAWRLLADLLSGDWGGAAASAAVPASILIAAAAATRHAVGEGGRAAADGVNSGKGSGGADGGSDDTEPSQLLAAVDAVLRALMMPKDCSGRGSSSNIGRAQQHGGRSGGVGAPPSSAASAASAFRPSLEQLVALVAGVLDVQPPRSVLGGSDLSPDDVGAESAWARLAATCVWCLERSAASSANPKKVFTSVVGRLMAPLTPLAFPTPDDSSGSSGGSGDDVRSQLAAAARALLEVSLLHEVHVVGIAAAAGAKLEAADAKLKEAAAGGGGDAGASGDAQGGKKAKRQKAAKGAGQQEQGQEEAAAAAAAGADGGDGGEACGARTYHGLLFQVLEEGVAALKDGSGGGVSAACAPQHARVQQAHGLLLSMPWLLVGFCRVAARHRSVLAADAAAAAAHGRRPGQMHGGGGSSKHGGGGREAAKGGGEGGGGASSSTSLVGAEFRLFSVLSGMLLGQLAGSASLSAQLPGGAPQAPPVAHATPPGKAAGQRKRGRGTDEQQQQQQLGGTSVAPVAAVVAASSGERRAPLAFAMAALLEAVRATGTYQPTRDLSGAQRGVLTRAAASLVAAANDPRGMGGLPTAPGSGSTDSAGRQKQTQQQLLPALAVMSVDADAARLVVGVSAAMCALLDLDHRTLQPVLDDVWRLLWLTAAAGTSATLPPGVEGGAEEAGPLGTADAGAAAGSTAAFVTTHISVRGGGGAHSVSVSACVRLVFAYKELRQLHVLMGSMLGALRAVAVTGGGGGGGDSATDDTGSAAEGAVAAAAAAEVARDPRLLRALSTAVRDLPPGQSPGLVDLIATDLEQQLGGAGGEDGSGGGSGRVPSSSSGAVLLAVGDIYCACLSGALLAPAAGIAAMTPDALRALMTVLRSVRSGVAATKTANSQLQWPSSAMQQVQQQQQQQPGASFLVCAWMDVVASTPVWARWADPRDTTATLQAMMLTAAEAGVCAQQQQQQQPRGDGDGGSLLTHAGAWCVRALCGEQLLQLAGVQACVPAALARATSSLLQQMASGGGAGGGDGGSSDSALVLLACLQATGDDAVEALHACHRQAASTATGQAAAAEPSPSSSAAVTAAEAAAHESEARLSSQLAATLDDQAHVMTAYVERWRDGGGIGGDGGKAPAAGGVTGDGCATDNAAPMRLAELLVLARGAHLGCLTTRQLRAVSDVALACGALCVAPLLEDAEAWAGARGVAGTLPGGRGGGRQASDASGNASRAQKRTQWALHALRCALGLACDAQSLLLVRRAAQVVADARGSGSAGSHSSNGAAVLPGSEPALNWALPLVTFAAMAQTVPAAASAASSGSGVPPDLDAAESAAAFVRVVADSAWAASSSPTAARHSSSHPGDCVRQAALRKAVLGAGAALARDAERGLGAGSGISSGGGSGGKKGRGKGAGSGVVTVTAHVTSSDGGSAQSAYCASAALAAVTSAMARAESAAASARPPAQRTSSNGAAAEAEASRQLLRDTLASLGASAATLAAAASAAAVATDAAASQQASSVAGGSDAMQRGNLLRHAAACLLAVCGHAEAVAAPPLPTASADADTDADDGQLDPLQRQRATLSLGRSLLLAGSVGGGNGGDGGVAMAGWHGGGRAALRVVSHLASVSARLPGDMRAHAARSGVGSEGGDGVGDAGDASALCGERRAIEHLLSVHVDLMGGLCPAAHAPRAHGGGSSTWATLTADVEGGSDAAHARLALLASLRGMLAACSRSQVLVVARWLADELLAGEAAWSGSGSMAHARGFGRSDGDNSGVDGAAAAAAGRGGSAPLLLLLCDAPSASAWLLPRLQATLLCLEGVASPASLSAMASASPLLWRSLLLMLPRLLLGVLQRTSSLLACLLRHRSAGLQRCMPLVVAGSRAMLHGFVAAARHTQGSSGRDSDDYVLHAAAELARVYEAAASGGTRVVAKYAMHMLGDYVCAAAAVVPLWALEDASGVAPSGMAADEEPVAVLTPGASAALRQGAYYLMAVLGPAELQHLHVALGTSMGGARRAALATLMAEYEKAFKFEGKV
ncbi:hypothetical protein FOA52_011279 [Chlamydomonas sp. UWO 241]|nr:hypothetical protein FOA52_011279 [Chlamydomonas sp. UWO 241]